MAVTTSALDEIAVSDNIIRTTAFTVERLDQEDEYRLERAVGRLRRLLNDPHALMARAEALLNGTAKPLLALAVVGLTALRMVGGPPSVPSYYLNDTHRRYVAAVTVVHFDSREVA